MTTAGHLWAIGYDDMERAAQVRDAITRLGETRCLIHDFNESVSARYNTHRAHSGGATIHPH